MLQEANSFIQENQCCQIWGKFPTSKEFEPHLNNSGFFVPIGNIFRSVTMKLPNFKTLLKSSAIRTNHILCLFIGL